MAHAITYLSIGGPEVLRLTEIPEPSPAAGEVLVEVQAVGVNPVDAKLRSGVRASAPITAPRRVGSDGAGVVAAVASDVVGFRVGDPVVFFRAAGAYADRVAVPVDRVHPLPPGVSAAQGAALGIPVGTAYQALRSLAVGAADTVLVHGGSGAVGQAIVQFATLWGARVIATASPRRFDRLRALGAHPVAYGDGLADRVHEAAPEGITVAIDAAGTDEALAVSIELVSDRDRVATLVRGADAAHYGIRAFQGGAPTPLTAPELAWRSEAIPVALALMAAGRFSVELGPEFPLGEAEAAHRSLESGTDGKIVLIP